MRFKRFLIERQMTLPMALKVFDLNKDQLDDKDFIKRRYRKLAIAYHPDRGGDVKKMQDVNDAYAVLAKASGEEGRAKSRMDQWKERQEKEKRFAEQIKQELLNNFYPQVFMDHFEKYFKGTDFKYEIKTKKNSPGFTAEFFTSNRDIVFTIDITADLIDIIYGRGGLGAGEEFSYKLYTTVYGFFNNKKQKMFQRDWGMTRDHSFLRQPEILFPAKKMKNIASGKTSERPFKKRDMETFLRKKLNADLDGEFAWIPLGDDYKLLIYRQVFMRKGAWGVNGIYKKKGKYGNERITQSPVMTLPESEFTAKLLENVQKEAKKLGDNFKVKTVERLLKKAYEDWKRSIGM